MWCTTCRRLAAADLQAAAPNVGVLPLGGQCHRGSGRHVHKQYTPPPSESVDAGGQRGKTQTKHWAQTVPDLQETDSCQPACCCLRLWYVSVCQCAQLEPCALAQEQTQ
jgi:hypothetical protein